MTERRVPAGREELDRRPAPGGWANRARVVMGMERVSEASSACAYFSVQVLCKRVHRQVRMFTRQGPGSRVGKTRSVDRF
jgi:hypothetical protein